MGLKVKSYGKLKDQLENVRQRLQSTPAGGKLTLPPEMKWWYYHEFGTAAPYPIDTIFARYLRLPETPQHPQELFTPRVGPPFTELHPPIAARHMVGRVHDDILRYVAQCIGAAMRGTFDPQAAHEELMTRALPYAVQKITDSFEEQLPGSSPDGKLQGESAADAFASSVKIEEL